MGGQDARLLNPHHVPALSRGLTVVSVCSRPPKPCGGLFAGLRQRSAVTSVTQLASSRAGSGVWPRLHDSFQ